MGKIIRQEFLGNPLWFGFLCISIIGIPDAILYLRESTVTIVDEVADPEEFMDRFRSRGHRSRRH